jgi:GH15 family glucan-1,4-alpha-glucosidase
MTADHPYLPIERHAAIGDRRTAALVGADGTIDWCCLPDFDGDVIFGALLDSARGGAWRVGPAERSPGEQRYVENSAVAETRWSAEDWELELVDAMPWPERAPDDARAAQRLILRRLRCLRGSPACVIELQPRHMFGAPVPVKTSDRWHGTEGDGDGGRWLGFWASDPAITQQLETGSRAEVRLNPGETLWMLLGEREEPADWSVGRAQAALEQTLDAWNRWVSRHPFLGPYRAAVIRSVLTIRLLSHQASGGQVAAPTCSLPEKIGGERNYDYRYAWIRDSSLALAILAVMGDLKGAEHYMDWLAQLDSASEMPLQVLYGLDGRCALPESKHADLDGYRASRPVRFGNDAFGQFQLDSLGYFADCAHIYLEQGGAWKPAYWDLVERVARFTAENWQRMDNGIWELDQMRHYVSSKAMSWVVLDRACKIAGMLGVAAPHDWRNVMDAIHADVMARGWSESRQAFRQHYDSDELDASVLLLANMGFLPADHPRMVATVATIRAELEQDGFVWRFHPRTLGHADAPLDALEGAFLPCTFWLASVLARLFGTSHAREVLDRVEQRFGTLGLFPEELDPASGAALGNMPLLFSHAEHLKAVMDYAKSRPITHAAMAAGKLVRGGLRLAGRA